MKRIWTAVMLSAIIAGIGLIPVGVYAGSAYNRPCPEGRGYYVSSVTPYPSSGYIGDYAREEHRTTYRSPDAYDRAEAPDYPPCEKQVRTKAYHPDSTRMVQKTTVVVDCQKPVTVRPCPTPRKVKPACVGPCPTELQRVKDDFLVTKSKLDAAQKQASDDFVKIQKLLEENATWRERERVSSVERQKLVERNAILEERARNREAWIENYGKEYIKNNGWR